jgi:hypothetical protein
MNDQTFLQTQVLELRRLLEAAGNDTIIAPQLRERLAEAEAELQQAGYQEGNVFPKGTVAMPRAAIFIRGGGVQDSQGIRPSLAGELLIQYGKMFTAQAVHDEREAARKSGRKRRPRNAPVPEVLFTGTPRGSFGLEFVPKTAELEDESLLAVHARSFENIASAIISITRGDGDSLGEAVRRIPSPMLQPLKQFVRILAENGADLRLAFADKPSASFGKSDMKAAAERLEMDVSQGFETVSGVFRGVTLDSGSFDFRTDSGTVITGTVADELTEEDLEQMERLVNQRGEAEVQRTIVNRIGGPSATTYVLLKARGI